MLFDQRGPCGGERLGRDDLERISRGIEQLPEHQEGQLVHLVTGRAAEDGHGGLWGVGGVTGRVSRRQPALVARTVPPRPR